ncbi:MAG: hypothetical protein J2P25_23570, partial [Nocardiopsaceae bacterium]|nr:hypothetical protein [Nocardiopsaceae bacterium]
MSDFAEWFFEDTGDKLVRRRLEGKLQAASTTQAREARDLRSRMSQIQGTLEQRLDRLAKAFDAFVELSDVRAELAVFEEQTTIRHAAHRLLRTLVRHVTDPSALAGDIPALPDSMPRCPGYWLRPAVVSLSAAASGDTTGAIAALAEARDLDQARTATFLAVGLGLAGRPAEALPLLSAALGTPAEQTTYAQRALWRACAHGVYGDQGEQAARAWLTGYVRGLDAGSADKERAKWDSDADYAFGTVNLATQARRGLPDSLSGEDALTGPLVAGGKLSALSSWVREAVTGEPARSGAGAPAGPAPA